jgi:hypothetical protein
VEESVDTQCKRHCATVLQPNLTCQRLRYRARNGAMASNSTCQRSCIQQRQRATCKKDYLQKKLMEDFDHCIRREALCKLKQIQNGQIVSLYIDIHATNALLLNMVSCKNNQNCKTPSCYMRRVSSHMKRQIDPDTHYHTIYHSEHYTLLAVPPASKSSGWNCLSCPSCGPPPFIELISSFSFMALPLSRASPVYVRGR